MLQINLKKAGGRYGKYSEESGFYFSRRLLNCALLLKWVILSGLFS